MLLRQVLEVADLLDSPTASARRVAKLLRSRSKASTTLKHVRGSKGATTFIRCLIPGILGKSVKGPAPTLGIIGCLGGVGARPARVGMVSDADGSIAALASALKLSEMHAAGDQLAGDVLVCTHVCPNAPIVPHDPVPFQASPIDMETKVRNYVDPAMDAILSIDTTKGNRLVNVRGIAISPTVKQGWILRVSMDLLDIMQDVTGRAPVVLPITMQDITPYANKLFHLNSILQPSTATDAPVVGVAITTESPVSGCATGASHATDVEQAARYAVQVATSFASGNCRFFDDDEFRKLVRIYGEMSRLQQAR